MRLLKIWIDCPNELYVFKSNHINTYLLAEGCLGLIVFPTPLYGEYRYSSKSVLHTSALQIRLEDAYTEYPGYKHAKLQVIEVLPERSRYEIKLSQLLESWYRKYPIPK